ncbi:MAG TPA: kelch repeat-containing protein, partial [Verrucomicrobiae bacterium]|nr:kelch repeat-containing protein [Verrucomicrobiae bacterium]
GTLTFYWEKLGQADEFDLEFDANGDYVNDIPAQTGWSQQTFQLSAGTNFLMWNATTSSGSSPSDAGFVGDIVFTPPPPPPPFIPGTWTLTSNMVEPLYGENLVLLTNGMAFTYEGSTNGNPNSETETVQLFNPGTGSWSATANAPVIRLSPLVVTLTNGNVLACGGVGLISADVYNPATAQWSSVNPMSNPHYGGTITLLPSGRALAVGGDDTNSDPTAGAEIYNPTTQSWTPTTPMATNRTGLTATLLTNGLVLVANGVDDQQTFLPTGYVYNPVNGTWTNTGPMVTPRTGATATLLPNGQVLVAGGFDSNYQIQGSAELYNPVTGTWTSAGNMVHLHAEHIASLLPNGMVLIAGGVDNSGASANAEIYNPTTGIWGTTSPMQTNRAQIPAVRLNDGRVLVAGGYNGLAVYASAETFSLTSASPGAIVITSATRLPNKTFQLGFTNIAGSTNTVFGSTNVGNPFASWLSLGTATEISNGVFQFTDTTTNLKQRYYRVVSP